MTTASSPKSGGPGQHQTGRRTSLSPWLWKSRTKTWGAWTQVKNVYNNIYISPFCYARLTLSPQQYRRPAGVLLLALLPPDRHGHRQRLHSVAYVDPLGFRFNGKRSEKTEFGD